MQALYPYRQECRIGVQHGRQPPAQLGGISVCISVTTWGERHHGNTAVVDDSLTTSLNSETTLEKLPSPTILKMATISNVRKSLSRLNFPNWLNAEITDHWRHGLQVIRDSVPEHESVSAG